MILIVPCSDIFRLAVTMLQLMCNTPSIRRQVKHQFHNTLKSFLKVLTEGVTSYLTEKYFLTFFFTSKNFSISSLDSVLVYRIINTHFFSVTFHSPNFVKVTNILLVIIFPSATKSNYLLLCDFEHDFSDLDTG